MRTEHNYFDGDKAPEFTAEVNVLSPKPQGNDGGCGLTPPDSIEGIETLADVQAAYADTVSSHKLRGQYRAACNTMGRVIGRPLTQIPVAPPSLKTLLMDAMPANATVSGQRWTKVQSLIRRALRDIGIKVAPGRDSTPLSQAWQALNGGPEVPPEKAGLSRILRYASRQGIDPDAFNVGVFDGFRAELEACSLDGDVDAICRQTARCWNRAIVANPGWPKICLPISSDGRQFSLEWSAFPARLVEEVEAFLASGSSTDALDSNYGRPVRPATLKSRRDRLRILASALVLSGAKRLDEVTSLSVVVEVENFKAALAYLRDRGGALKAYHGGLVALAKTITRHWIKDEDAARKIKAIEIKIWNAVDEPAGMKMKNRVRLRQFDIDDNVDTLFALPSKVLLEANKSPQPTRKDAIRVMQALQVAILSYTPIRLQNLTGLELGKSILDNGPGRNRIVRIYLAPEEVKNSREYDAPLPKHIFPLLDAWLKSYRPLICAAYSPYLFPNPEGRLRDKNGVGTDLKAFIKRETGLIMHVHLFRHLMAKLYLAENPTDIETVRQVLNHKSCETTQTAYIHLHLDGALKRYQDAALSRPVKAPKAKPTKKRGKAD